MSESNRVGLTSGHFTEVLIENLLACVAAIPSHHAGGMAAESVLALFQSRTGISRKTNENLLACLYELQLATDVEGIVGRSKKGDRLRRDLRLDGAQALVPIVMRSGYMADQIRALRSVLRRTGDTYHCGRSVAQSVAPQLVGLLGRMPDVAVGGQLTIGPATALELESVWNELPVASRLDWQDINKRRKAIGDRAEQYSIQLERSSFVGAIERIIWVSRDDDALGYDIEVNGDATRRIEVKGSSGRDVQFFLSANEYRVAKRYRENYEIQFWGQVNLRLEPQDDYERLRGIGYPICVPDAASALSILPWKIEPSQYRVVRKEG